MFSPGQVSHGQFWQTLGFSHNFQILSLQMVLWWKSCFVRLLEGAAQRWVGWHLMTGQNAQKALSTLMLRCLLMQSEWGYLVMKSHHILETSWGKKKNPCHFHLSLVHCAQMPGICVCLGQNKGLYVHKLRLLNLARILRIKHQFPRVLWRVSAEYRRRKHGSDSTGERSQSSSLAPSGAGFLGKSPRLSSVEPGVGTAWLLASVRF